MKKYLILLLSLLVLSPSALATKARLLALGETNDQAGSFYISDNRNIFLNSAYVNEYSDMVTFEWGGQGHVATREDTDTSPKGEGGVFKSFGKIVAGIYLGAESNAIQETRSYVRLADAGNPKIHQDNQIDVFIGGEAAVKWGANLSYSKNKDDANNMSQNSLVTRLGVIADKFEALANIALISEAQVDGIGVAGKDKFIGKLGFEIGGNYDVGNDIKVFALWRHAKFTTETVTNAAILGAGTVGPAYTGKADLTINKYRLGAGRSAALNSKAKVFTKIEYVRNTRDAETVDGDADLVDYTIPVTIGLEYDAASWLILRGSVYQSLIGKQDYDYDTGLQAKVNPVILDDLAPGKRTLYNTTNVNAGATFKFGNLAIDGLIGTGTAAGGTTDSKSEHGLLTLDNLMTRVAMTYSF